MVTRQAERWLGLALLGAVAVVYSNHFQNTFHFDDSHAVESNAAIRSLANVPRMFVDGTLFSSLPLNQSYRPLTTASLAVDYWFGGGLKPFFFHLSTFIWFLGQLALMVVFFRALAQRTVDGPEGERLARWAPWVAAAWYGLHPAMAETVNYVIQRSEVQAAVGVLGGLVLWLRKPGRFGVGWWLLPLVLGTLAKPLAIMFAPLLWAYVLLFEADLGFNAWAWRKPEWARALRSLSATLPAWLGCGALYLFQRAMTPSTFTTGASDAPSYWLTQPYVLTQYATTLLWPMHLTADTDLGRLPLGDARVWLGLGALVGLGAVAVAASIRRRTRPVAFGVAWFFVASVPTSVTPLAEVANDHRLYLPFVGLVFAVVWPAALAVSAALSRAPTPAAARRLRLGALGLTLGLLAAFGFGAHQRNAVWATEESLWADASHKSPNNGRAVMNYGLTLLAKGDPTGALALFEQARRLLPNYYALEINLGIANGELGRDAEAERHFRRADDLAPRLSKPRYFYARWLKQRNRVEESVALLDKALYDVPNDVDVQHALMQSLADLKRWPELRAVVNRVRHVALSDEVAERYAQQLAALDREVLDARAVTSREPTVEHWLDLSLAYYRAARFEESLGAAQEALKLKPDSAEAYNNLGSAHASLGRYDAAIEAEQRALAINPRFTLAENNLRWAEQMKARTATRGP